MQPMTTSPAIAKNADELRIVHARTLRGPNVWHLAPVVLAELRAGALAALAPCEVPGFGERLLDVLPGVDAAADGSPDGREASARTAAVPHSWGEALSGVA